jgi:hypothetical protein
MPFASVTGPVLLAGTLIAPRATQRDAGIDRRPAGRKHRLVPIAFFDLLADDGWEPLQFDPADPTFYWNDGGWMTSAPVDIAATFDGAMWASTNVEREFKWRGRKIRPGFTVPKRHHNLRQLMILVGGELDVEYGEDNEKAHLSKVGEFWVAEKWVPYTMTAGPAGVTYLESWTEPIEVVDTHWHDDRNWKRR